MSNAVLPTLPGLTFPVVKTPTWSTKVQTATSGKETRVGFWSYPIWKYSVGFDVLRSSAVAELQTLAGFFNARNGSFDSFLFEDPDDNHVADQVIVASSDGVTLSYQLFRSLGGYAEPVQAPKSDAIVYTSGYFGFAVENKLKWSQGFDNAAWVKSNCTVAADTTTDPLATNTADTVTRTASGNHYLYQIAVAPAVSGRTFTFSVWIKGGSISGQTLSLRMRNGTETTEIATSTTLGTGWQKLVVTGTFIPGSGDGIKVYIDPDNDAGAAGDYFYAWGAQLEEGAVNAGMLPTTDTPYTHSISPNGTVTFSFAPYYLTVVKWTGSFYWRCRFLDDHIDLSKFMTQLWELKTLNFQSVK